jgi:putative MATE family efflux protein
MSASSRRPSEAILNGPVAGTLIRLAGPVILSNVLQTAYQLTDTFWVGRLGANAVAAVSLSFPLMFLLISVGAGITIAGTILVAQYEGRQDPKQVNYVAAQTYTFVTIVAVGLSVIGYIISEPALRLIGASPDVLPDAATYLKISFVGLAFVYGYFVFQALFRGVGDVNVPLYVVFGTVLLNAVLDPLLILGPGPFPEMGVTGAALATVTTQGIAALVGFGLLLSGRRPIRVYLHDMRPDWRHAERIARLGFPASVEQSTRALGLTAMTTLVAAYGSGAVAAYGIGSRIFSFILIPALGLSMATSTAVGQNIGAGQWQRAHHTTKVGAWIAFGALSAAGLITFIWAEVIVAAFIPGEPAVIEEGAEFLRISAPTWGFIGIQVAIGGSLTGAGRTFVSMSLALISLWVLQFPTAFFLSERWGLGLDGIWWAFPVSNVLAATLGVLWYSRSTRLVPVVGEVTTDRVVEEKAVAEATLEHPME